MPALLLIEPPVAVAPAVTLTAEALIAPETKAEAPKTTLRPADKVMVPSVDETVLLIVISPSAVAEVMPIFPAALIAAATVIPLPEFNVMVLSVAVTDALTVKSPTADADVKVIATLPRIVPPTVNVLPAVKPMVPKVDVTVPLPLLIKSPEVVCAVKDTFIPALIAALMLKLRPANKVTVPRDELIADEIVMSPTAPVEVKLTLPKPPALMAPLTAKVDDVADVTKVMLPVVLVVMPLVVKLPVAAVKLKLTPVNTAATSVDVVLLVIV